QRRVDEAWAMIDRAGLARGRLDERPSPGPSGLVVDQSLKPGTQVRPKTPIDLSVSQLIPAPPPVVTVVPDVRQLRVDEAWALVAKAGLSRGTVEERPSPGPSGLVLDQSLV